MRKLALLVMMLVAVVLVTAPAATAAVHPITCSDEQANANASENIPTGDVANPPGLTPNGVFFGFPHEDPLEAADGIADFAPIFAVLGADENALHSFDKNC